ncbi:MAG: hypothetical protein K8T90_05955 [Planctomycetes bacterium]|nr:hypothetical protein [Planctomycetota bacterium]
MQDDPPPPRAAPPLATPFAAPYPPPPQSGGGDAVGAAQVEASARSAKRLAAWSVGLTLLGVLCCGGGSVAILKFLGVAVNEQENKLRGAERRARMRQETEALLQTLADGLRASGDELPEALPEAAPRDPWVTAIRYKRGATDATLTSAGPDRKFGTRDDITLRVEPPK